MTGLYLNAVKQCYNLTNVRHFMFDLEIEQMCQRQFSEILKVKTII